MQQVTIQIVTWNSAGRLRECLRALQTVDQTMAQIRVIDNGSKDESVSLVKQLLPHADIVCLPANTGFAGGHNVGFTRCTTPLVAVLNPDVALDWPGLQKTLDAFVDGEVGAVQGLLMRHRHTIDSAGVLLTAACNGYDRGAGEEDRGQFAELTLVDAVTGACGLYRMEALRKVVYQEHEIFDEDFWAYKEDIDLGWRLRRAGWKILYIPVVVGQHPRALAQEGVLGWPLRASSMLRRLRDRRSRYSFRNWLWMIAKNIQGGELLGHSLPILGRLSVFGLLTLLYWPWFSVWLKTARGLPTMIAKRGNSG